MKTVKPIRSKKPDYTVVAPRTFGTRWFIDQEHNQVTARVKVTPLMIERVKEIARRCQVQPGTRIEIVYAGKGWSRIAGRCHNSYGNRITYLELKRWDYTVIAHELRHTAQAQAFATYPEFIDDYRSYSGMKVTKRYFANPYEVDAREHEAIGAALADWCPAELPEEPKQEKPKQAHRMRWFWDPSIDGDRDLVPKPGGAGHRNAFGEEARHQAECTCGWRSGIAENAVVSEWVKWHKADPEAERT